MENNAITGLVFFDIGLTQQYFEPKSPNSTWQISVVNFSTPFFPNSGLLGMRQRGWAVEI